MIFLAAIHPSAYLAPPPPVPQSETVDDFLVVVWTAPGFPSRSATPFTLALRDVQFVVVPRSFLDQSVKDLERKHEVLYFHASEIVII